MGANAVIHPHFRGVRVAKVGALAPLYMPVRIPDVPLDVYMMTLEDRMGDALSAPNTLPDPGALVAELEYSIYLFWETLAEMEQEEIESAKLPSGWNV